MRAVGTLRYSPKLNGCLDRRDGGSTKWWLVIDVDPEIGKYYRHLYSLWTYRVDKLQRPAWETHVSVIRDEEPAEAFKPIWERYNGQEIEFEYDTTAETEGNYVWFPVWCERALDIRVELGLVRDPFFPLHMTFGNFKF